MTIPLVSNTGTYDLWIGRTNQAIGVINQLTDGALTVNGSISFANSNFAMSLPSLNVANNIVVTQPSGNSVFLTSSGMSVNGTIYAIGSKTSLVASNTAIFGSGLSVVSGNIATNAEIQTTLTGAGPHYRAVFGNTAAMLRNDGTNFYVLTTGSVATPISAVYNTLRPLIINLTTGAVTIDNTGVGTTIGGNLTLNQRLTVTGNSTLTNTSTTTLTATNFTVTGTTTLTNTTLTNLTATTNVTTPTITVSGSATAQSANITNSWLTTSNITTLNANTLIIPYNGAISSNAEIRSYSLGTANGGGQFRAIQGNYGVFFRNDGNYFTFMQTANVGNPQVAGWNGIRPFAWNLTTGAVTIDGSANGTSFGGNVTVSGNETVSGNLSVTGTTTLANTNTTNLVVASENSGPLAGHRNVIINGSFDIWQRGTSFTNPSGYVADRWTAGYGESGATVTVSQQPVTDQVLLDLGLTNWLNWNQTVAGTGGTWKQLVNRVEKVRTLAGRQVTLGFWAKTDSGSFNINAFPVQNFGTGGSPSTNWNGPATQWTITTTPQFFSTTFTFPSIVGKTVGSNNDANIQTVFNLPLNATFNLYITGIQLEVGPVPTPFEYRPIVIEMAMCQRYYQIINQFIVSGVATAASQLLYGNYVLPVTMRAAPSVSFANQGYTNASGYSLNATSPALVRMQITSSGAGVAWGLSDIILTSELA